ncbi:MAG TPA: PD-(D/E)XK motif protein [Arcobacter sp.]|nr:PD-(D/E)XK motif protein [Arcobacter sp.]
MRSIMMIRNDNSPWENMEESSQRRVDSETEHNLFWITDLEGKYGFCLQSKNIFKDIKPPASLKGISVLKRNSNHKNGELFLVLNKKEDWQIFHTLCEDLISITHKYDNDESMISAVEVRLKRWQQLFRYERNIVLSLEAQMGLFSELLTLREILVPKVGIEQSIISWVGADFDKQDFLLANAIIEVKSYRTSKSPIVHISSLQQLYSDKEPLYLLTYGLTQVDNGLSIDILVNDIYELLENKSAEVRDIFDNRLIEYGFIPELIEKSLFKFTVDKRRVYYITDEFPKILPQSVSSQILTVKYAIDLLQCSEFEADIENIIIR